MLNKQIEALTTILTNDDLQNYAGDGFWNLIQAVITEDPFSALSAGKDIKELIFHMPTALFWGKMKRFLTGTFHSFEDQIKMAQKFNEDNKEYASFVKRQIHLINALDDDLKIDYFAELTRCFLSTDLDSTLYFKLCKFLSTCTPEELFFLEKCKYDFKGKNNAIISSLFQYGLFTQIEEDETSETFYVLSDFAKALKQNSLNFKDGLHEKTRLVSYGQLAPLNLPESATTADIDKMFNDVFEN